LAQLLLRIVLVERVDFVFLEIAFVDNHSVLEQRFLTRLQFQVEGLGIGNLEFLLEV
jgi:hypothetical protein